MGRTKPVQAKEYIADLTATIRREGKKPFREEAWRYYTILDQVRWMGADGMEAQEIAKTLRTDARGTDLYGRGLHHRIKSKRRRIMGKIYSSYPTEFPFTLTVKSGGNTFQHRFHEGDEVICIFCGEKFALDEESAFRYRHKYDGNAKIFCGNCGRVADAVYYANEQNRVSLKAWDSPYVKTI